MKLNIILISSAILIFAACKKNPSSIGLDIHPESDKVSAAVAVIDSTGLRAYTFSEDSLSTDERSIALLGCYNDPVFGLSSASFITQVRILSFNVNFGTNAHVDSMKLVIDYQSYYGDTTSAQTFHIYEMENAIYPDSEYYSNFNPDKVISPSGLICSHSYYPSPNDTALVVSLPTIWAQKFIDAPSTVWQDNTNFLDFFKGLCFIADTNNPGAAIIYYNLLSTRTKLIMYYTNDSTSSTFSFSINSNCARINLFRHNYSFSQLSGLNDTVNIHSNLFIQGMSGTGVKLFLPGLETFKDSGIIVIAKAELVIPVNTNYDASLYPVPAKLLNVAVKSDNTYSFLPDYLSGTAYFNGIYDDINKEYRFNIGRYVQQLISGERTDYGLAILCSDNRISSNRTIINNTGNPNGIRLELYYFKP